MEIGKIVFIKNFDVMKELKKKGYPPKRIREEKILSQGTLTSMRKGIVPLQKLDLLCTLLERSPGSFIKFIPPGKETENN